MFMWFLTVLLWQPNCSSASSCVRWLNGE